MTQKELAILKDLLARFEAVCEDVDGKIDPADKARIRKAGAVLFKLEFPFLTVKVKK